MVRRTTTKSRSAATTTATSKIKKPPFTAVSVQKAFMRRAKYLEIRANIWKSIAPNVVLDTEPTTLQDPLRGGRGRKRKICLYSSVDRSGAKVHGVPIVRFAHDDTTGMLPLLYTGNRFSAKALADFRVQCHDAAAKANLFEIAHDAVNRDVSNNPMQTLVNSLGQLPIHESDNFTATIQLVGVMPYLVGLCYQKAAAEVTVPPAHDVAKLTAAHVVCRHIVCGRLPEERNVRFINAVLNVLMAHSVNASNTTAQVLASAKGTLKNVVQGGLIALMTAAHGGAQAKVMPMVRHLIDHLKLKGGQVPTREQIADWAEFCAQNKIVFEGFGHAVLKDAHDARGLELRQLAEGIPGIPERWEFKILAAIQDNLPEILRSDRLRGYDSIARMSSVYINVDFWAGPLQELILGVRDPRCFVLLFALARYIDYVVAKLVNDALKLAIVREDSYTETEIEALVAAALAPAKRNKRRTANKKPARK